MIRIERTRNGENTIVKDGSYLLSQYSPKRDIERYLSGVSLEENYFYILFGSTLGYMSDALIKRGIKKENILVYELEDLPLEYFLDSYQGISRFNNVFLMSGLIEQKIKEQKKPYVLCLESYKRAYAGEFEDFSIALKRVIQIAVENIKVSAFFSKVWFINFFRNLSLASRKENAFYWEKGKLQKFPALVVASGPSLDDCIIQIKENQKGFIIIAVLSAVPSLLWNGVKPDFIFLTDGGVFNKLHGYNIPEDIPVFASIYASSAFLSTINNPVIYYDFVEEIANPSFQLKYPSVTIDAGLFAKSISDKVIFAGFDLACSITKGSHCSKSVFMSFLERSNNRYNKPYSILTSFLKRDDLIAINENKTFSNQQFYMVKELSERLFNGCEYIEGGVSFNTLRVLKDFNFDNKKFLDRKEAIKNICYCFRRNEFFVNNIKKLLEIIAGKIKSREEIFLTNIFIREKMGNIDIEPLVEYYLKKIRRI